MNKLGINVQADGVDMCVTQPLESSAGAIPNDLELLCYFVLDGLPNGGLCISVNGDDKYPAIHEF